MFGLDVRESLAVCWIFSVFILHESPLGFIEQLCTESHVYFGRDFMAYIS